MNGIPWDTKEFWIHARNLRIVRVFHFFNEYISEMHSHTRKRTDTYAWKTGCSPRRTRARRYNLATALAYALARTETEHDVRSCSTLVLAQSLYHSIVPVVR